MIFLTFTTIILAFFLIVALIENRELNKKIFELKRQKILFNKEITAASKQRSEKQDELNKLRETITEQKKTIQALNEMLVG